MSASDPEPEEIPVIEMEVDPEPEKASSGGRSISAPPVHPLAAVVLLAVDNLWNFADWAVATWWFTIPASFATVFVPTLLVQRFVKGDPPRRAFRLALLLGALAAVPTSIFGTPLGLAFLAWSGLNRLFGPSVPRGGKSFRKR
jgi:hypothetical protein